jgi:bifunctional non-homologous end joining protein LigD
MRRRGPFSFVAFDLLAVNGGDVRKLPLADRERILRDTVPKESRCILFAKHVARRGRDLFAAVCEQDLEGIVAKWKDAPYNPAALALSWLKVKNPQYIEVRAPHQLFESS